MRTKAQSVHEGAMTRVELSETLMSIRVRWEAGAPWRGDFVWLLETVEELANENRALRLLEMNPLTLDDGAPRICKHGWASTDGRCMPLGNGRNKPACPHAKKKGKP